MANGKSKFEDIHLQWFAEDGFDKAKFQEYLNTEEGTKWFSDFVGSLGYKSATAFEKLSANNQKLLDQNVKVKQQLESMSEPSESFGKIVDLLKTFDVGLDGDEEVGYDTVERVLLSMRDNASGSGDTEQVQRDLAKALRDSEVLQRQIKKLTDEKQQAVESVGERDSVIANLLIDGAFESELRKAGYSDLVIPNILPALRSRSGAKVEKNDETGEYEAIVNDGGTIDEWVGVWKESDDGKALLPGGLNSGGGGHGGGGGGGSTKSWSEMSMSDKTELYKKNPELYRKLKEQG